MPKAARLRRPAEFKQVAAVRRQLVAAPLVLSYRVDTGADSKPRLGLAIAKKSVPDAVDRNRIKRLIREDFRLHRGTLPAADLVFHVRPGAATVDNATLRRCLASLRRQLRERCKPSSLDRSAPTSTP